MNSSWWRQIRIVMIIFNFFAFFSVTFFGNESTATCTVVRSLRIVTDLFATTVAIFALVDVSAWTFIGTKNETMSTRTFITTTDIDTIMITVVLARSTFVNISTTSLVGFKLISIMATALDSTWVRFIAHMLTASLIGILAPLKMLFSLKLCKRISKKISKNLMEYRTIKWKINLESVIFDTTCHKCWLSSQKHSLGPILCSHISYDVLFVRSRTNFWWKYRKIFEKKRLKKCNTHRFPTDQFHDNSITFESVISKFKSRWTWAKERAFRIYTCSRTSGIVDSAFIQIRTMLIVFSQFKAIITRTDC